MICIVPNCNNGNGARFPTEDVFKRLLVKILNLPEADLKSGNSLCYTHWNFLDQINKESNICRICMSDENVTTKFDDFYQDGKTIRNLVECCLDSIKILGNERLPQNICQSCLVELNIAYGFRLKCIKSETVWGEVQQIQRKRMSSEDVISGSKQTDDAPKITKIRIVDNSDEEITDSDQYLSAEDGTLLLKMKNIQLPNLPDCIRIKQAAVYMSKKGLFSVDVLKVFDDSNLFLIDGYLFMSGLVKNKKRYLHCIFNNCNAKAEQNIQKNTYDSDAVFVNIAHNHAPIGKDLLKQQIFCFVMAKKIQQDKLLNIRAVYDDFISRHPDLNKVTSLKDVLNDFGQYVTTKKIPPITSFEQFFDLIETDALWKLQFTHGGHQFYQEKFATDDGSKAVIFSNLDTINCHINDDKIMYVDSSFHIGSEVHFKYDLVTVLVSSDENFYPIMYAVVHKKTQDIFKHIFTYLRDVLAPTLHPHEIITDYESQLYYALGEVFSTAHIGGSIFYYVQNIYKKVCALNMTKIIETNASLRNVYHMLLMLPLLPVNTIIDALDNIEIQGKDISDHENVMRPLFEHVHSQWICGVTPKLFCVHQLENRINENVVVAFKKFRELLLTDKGKSGKNIVTITDVVQRLSDLDAYMRAQHTDHSKRLPASRDLTQKRNAVVRAWSFIETHPKINVNTFFRKVSVYIKSLENQLWIWGFYQFKGDLEDCLINADEFIVQFVDEDEAEESVDDEEEIVQSTIFDPDDLIEAENLNAAIVETRAEAVGQNENCENTFLTYVSL